MNFNVLRIIRVVRLMRAARVVISIPEFYILVQLGDAGDAGDAKQWQLLMIRDLVYLSFFIYQWANEVDEVFHRRGSRSRVVALIVASML